MLKVTQGAALVLPRRRREARYAVLLGNEALVDAHLRQLARLLVPFDRVRSDGGEVDVAGKVPRQVDKVRWQSVIIIVRLPAKCAAKNFSCPAWTGRGRRDEDVLACSMIGP